jgi:hypothetical protein
MPAELKLRVTANSVADVACHSEQRSVTLASINTDVDKEGWWSGNATLNLTGVSHGVQAWLRYGDEFIVTLTEAPKAAS